MNNARIKILSVAGTEIVQNETSVTMTQANNGRVGAALKAESIRRVALIVIVSSNFALFGENSTNQRQVY